MTAAITAIVAITKWTDAAIDAVVVVAVSDRL
jgi:hypothetical protein